MFFLIFILVFIGIWLTIGLVCFTSNCSTRNSQRETNSYVEKALKEKNFKETRRFLLTDNITYGHEDECKKLVLVDNENRKIAFVDYEEKKPYIVDFEQLVNYETYENNSSTTVGSGVGDNIGKLRVGIYTADTIEKSKNLRVIIRIGNFENPQVVYDVISKTFFNTGIKKSTAKYQTIISNLQEVISFLEVVKEENKKNKNDQA